MQNCSIVFVCVAFLLPAFGQSGNSVESSALMVFPSAENVAAFDMDGNLVWMTSRNIFSSPNWLTPHAVAVDPVREVVWVAVNDQSPSGTLPINGEHAIERYNLRTGRLIDQITVPFPAGTLESTIERLDVDREGACYAVLAQRGPAGPVGFEFIGIKIDVSGLLAWRQDYTAELWRDPIYASVNTFVGRPSSVRVAPDGSVWFIASPDGVIYGGGGRAVRARASDGQILASLVSGGADITFTPQGNIYLLGYSALVAQSISLADGQRDVIEYNPSGAFVRSFDIGGAKFGSTAPQFSSHISGNLILNQGFCGYVVADSFPPYRNPYRLQPLSGVSQYVVLNDPQGIRWGYKPLTSPKMLGSDPLGNGTCLGVDALRGASFGIRGRVWAFRPLTSSSPRQGYTQAVFLVMDPDPQAQVDPVTAEATLRPPALTVSIPGSQPIHAGSLAIGDYGAYHYCLTTDPSGDLDGDGTLNLNEFFEGTSPGEADSFGLGVTFSDWQPGRRARIELEASGQEQAPFLTVMGLASPPGTAPFRLPDARFVGPSPYGPLASLWLSPVLITGLGTVGTIEASGRATIRIDLPANPALNGLELEFGAVTLDPAWSGGIRSIHGPRRIQLGNL